MNFAHSEETLRSVFSAFVPEYEGFAAQQWHAGHINATYFIDVVVRGVAQRYVMQSVNTHVFPRIVELMDNCVRITDHLENKSKGLTGVDAGRDHIHFLRTVKGDLGVPGDGGDGFWRLYPYIDQAEGRLQASSPAEARAAAAAFGRFQAQLVDIPGPRLAETIPFFHDTRRRFAAMEAAAAADKCGRLAESKEVLEGLRALRAPALSVQEAFERGEMPERIVHNDAKYSNVLVDTRDGHAVCVIDLDTCMPGLALHDVGDLLRSMSADCPEDEPDTSKIKARLEMFEAIREGFLSEADSILTDAERRLFANGGIAMTCEVGVRFLTDHLEGDHYFHTKYDGHNLVRARSQLALARSMLATFPVYQ